MENQNVNRVAATGSDISAIRNILMGGHINQYEKQFGEVNATIHQNEANRDAQIKALEEQIDNRFKNLQAEMNDRFDKLEALLTDNVQRLNERVNTVSTTDKADLGRLLAEVSNRLING